MKVKKVGFQNLKGMAGAHDLGAATVIAGDNFTGKSTIHLAVRLALVGYLPAPIGKENRSIYEALAGNPDQMGQMSVDVTIEQKPGDTPITSRIVWSKSKTGTVSKEGSPPGYATVPAILADPKTFFGLSGPERIRTVFDAVPDASIDTGAFLMAVGEIVASPAATRDELVELIMKQTKARFQEGVPDQVAASELGEWLKGELKRAKDADKLKTGALQGAVSPTGAAPTNRSKQIEELTAEWEVAIRTEKHLDDINGQINSIEAKAQTRKDLEEELASLKRSAPTVDKTLDLALSQVEREIDVIKTAIIEQSESKRRWERASSAIASGTCPTCGCKGAALKEIKTTIDANFAASEAALKVTSEKLKEAGERRDAIKQKIRERAEVLDEYESAQARVKEIENEIAVINAMRVPDAPSNLAELIEKARASKVDVENRLKEQRTAHALWVAYNQNLTRRNQLESEMLEARCAVEVFAEASKALNEAVKVATEKAFGEVLKVSKKFTSGLLNSDLEFRDGELGRRVSQLDLAQGRNAGIDAWISHEAFSGTEELIAYAGFAVAIANRAPFKLVVMDELGRMTEQRKKDVVNRMLELTKMGVIDQFIGVDSDPGAWKKAKGITVIELAK